MSEPLGKFEGAPVVVTTVAITKAGDGLSDSMGIEPRVIHRGERLQIVMDVVAANVQFQPVDKGQTDNPKAPLARKVTLAAETVTILNVGDSAHVDQLLAEQRRRVEDHRESQREAETGEARLAGTLDAARTPASLTSVPD